MAESTPDNARDYIPVLDSTEVIQQRIDEQLLAIQEELATVKMRELTLTRKPRRNHGQHGRTVHSL